MVKDAPSAAALAAVAPLTDSADGWTVMRLVENVDNVLVGRQRKPRPFLALRHAAKSCEDAFAIAAEFGALGLRPGAYRVEHDSGTFFGMPGSDATAEYRAVCAKVLADETLVRAS